MNRKLFPLIALFLLVASAASASSISIFIAPDKVYQNTANNPCLFNGTGGSGCNSDPAGWPAPATDTNGSFSSDPLTRTYANADFTGFTTYVTNSFILGLDVNDTSTAQTLTTMTLDFYNASNTDLASYSFSPALDVPSTANGVGYADYILAAGCSGTISGAGTIKECSAYTPFVIPFGTTKIVTSFGYGGTGNDGPDRVFAISTGTVCTGPGCDVTVTPEPTSLLLLGTGLMGTVFGMRRRYQRKS